MREIPMADLARTLGAQLDETVRAVKINLFSGVIRDTRVDTGRLRGNWQTSTGGPAGGELDVRGDGDAIAEAEATVKGDTVDYLTNNLPYAEVWEERDGMVARNAARVERAVKEAVRAGG